MNITKNLFSKSWLFILIILVGVSLKFYRLDDKMFWYDELATVFHVAGADDVLGVSDAHLNEIAGISEYTRLLKHGNFDYPLIPQLKKQVRNMNLNPLHYPLLSIWYRLVGDDFVHYRLFSVLMFLLTLPFMFLLAGELFGSARAGWIAVSLYSVSPFIHYFAQEARYYILWAFLLVVIHYFLLKAVRSGKNKYWFGYVVFGVLSLYASALSGVMIFEHLLFVLIAGKGARVKFTVAIAVIAVLYAPWFFYLVANRNEIFAALAWHKFQVVPLWAPLLGLVLGLARTFSFYLNYTLFWDDVFHHITPAMMLETGFNLVILAVLVMAVISIIKNERRESAWFVLLIFLPGLLFFFALDIARHAITTHWWRYYIFNTIPVILLVTGLFARKTAEKKLVFDVLYIGFVVISLYSVATIAQYHYWYLGGNWQQEFVDNAKLLEQAERPLMITDFVWNNSPIEGKMHAMESLVDCNSPRVDVLRVSPDIQNVDALIPAKRYSDIFVIYASDQLLDNLQNQFGDRMEMLPGKVGPPRWIIRK